MTISSAQCRAARALLDWSQEQLAENAHVARATIADFERNTRQPMRNNLVSIISALEAAGVSFVLEEGDEGAGVRFRKVELEYNRTLKPEGPHIVISVRYKSAPFAVVVPREVLDDIDRATSKTLEERLQAVQNHFPIFLRTAEEAIISRRHENGYVFLDHSKFPPGTF